MENGDQKIKICSVSRKIFYYSLVWPSEETELEPENIFKIKVSLFCFMVGSVTLSLLIHICLMLTRHVQNIAEDTAIIIAFLGSGYMALAFIKQQHTLALLLKDLSDFQKYGQPPGFEEKNRKLNLLINFFFVYATMTIVFYGIEQFLQKSECIRINEEEGLSTNYCGLLAPVEVPFKVDYFPAFQICELYVFFTTYTLLKMPLFISLHVFEIVHHLVLRINHLGNMIMDCFNSKDYSIQDKKFTTCILYHIEILEFAERLDNTFFNCMFGHFALTGAICACLEKQIVDGINVYPGTLHICGWIGALFLGCTGGQHLLNSTDIIPEALWNSKWYEADLRLQKKVLFMLTRSQKNLCVNAGPLGILSYALFVSVLKMSYSILCMLTS